MSTRYSAAAAARGCASRSRGDTAGRAAAQAAHPAPPAACSGCAPRWRPAPAGRCSAAAAPCHAPRRRPAHRPTPSSAACCPPSTVACSGWRCRPACPLVPPPPTRRRGPAGCLLLAQTQPAGAGWPSRGAGVRRQREAAACGRRTAVGRGRWAKPAQSGQPGPRPWLLRQGTSPSAHAPLHPE